MNVPCKRMHLLDCDPDKDPDHNLDFYPDNFAPRKQGIGQDIDKNHQFQFNCFKTTEPVFVI